MKFRKSLVLVLSFVLLVVVSASGVFAQTIGTQPALPGQYNDCVVYSKFAAPVYDTPSPFSPVLDYLWPMDYYEATGTTQWNGMTFYQISRYTMDHEATGNIGYLLASDVRVYGDPCGPITVQQRPANDFVALGG